MVSARQVLIPTGKRGATGEAGLNGTDTTNVSLSKLDNPLCHVFLHNKISKTVSGVFTFDTDPNSDLFHTDRYGNSEWVLPETLTNYCKWSNDLQQWTDPLGNWAIDSAGITDPIGGNDADQVILGADTTSASFVLTFEIDNTSAPSNKNWTVTFWFKHVSGTMTALDMKLDGVVYPVVSGTLPSVWTKYEVKVPAMSGTPSTTGSVLPRGGAGARCAVTFFQAQPNNISTDLITTGVAIASTSNADYVKRQNDSGFYGDALSTNYALHSQDLSQSVWSFPTFNATISAYTGLSPEGTANESVLLVADSTSDITLRCTNANLVTATNYVISFYVFVNQGSHNEMTVNVGGGANVTTSEFADSVGFKRVTANVTSSTGGYLDINIVSPINGFQVVIWGVQGEIGQLTSYMKSGAAEYSRIADVIKCSFDGNAPLGSTHWSFVTEQSGLYNVSTNAALYEAHSTFKAVYSGDDLVVTNGTMTITLTDAISAVDVAITYDGTTLKGFLDGAEFTSSTSGTASTTTATDLFINKNLNGYMKNTKFYNEALHVDEVQYIAGVY